MSENNINLSKHIAEQFGANASYVEGLLARFQSDPNLVDESWRTFFSDLISGDNGQSVQAETRPVATVPASPERTAQPEKPKSAPSVVPADANAKALVGASKKIVENMEQSLTVPTATSPTNDPRKTS